MSRRVKSVHEGMLGVSVENPEMHSGRQRHRFEPWPTAVDEDQVILLSETRHSLIQNSARDTDEVILRVSARFDENLARRLRGDRA